MEKQSILFITREIVPFFYGGIGSQFKAMANLLVSEGYDVGFITRRHESFDDTAFQDHYSGCTYHFVDESYFENVTEFSYSGGLVSHFNLCYAHAVEKILSDIYKKRTPEYIVSADFGAESFICLMKKNEGKYRKSRFILFIEGSTFDALKTYESGVDTTLASELDDPQNILTCSMENGCIYMSDHVVSPTHITWQQTCDRLTTNINHTIIPNLLGTDFLTSARSKSKGQESKMLLFIGRLDHHKGADLLLQSFIDRYAKQKKEDIPMLRFIGRDAFCKKYGMTFLEYWREKIPDNLESHVDFTGQVLPATVKQNMSVATLCVFPSRWEVYGIVCLEAMAARSPVAVSLHTGLSEVVGDSFRAFAFDFAEDKAGVFDLYERLLQMDQKEYDSLCTSFYQRACEIVEHGNASLLEYFVSLPIKNSYEQDSLSEPVFTEIVKCVTAIGDISSILSHDFKRVVSSTDLDENALKKAVNPRLYGKSSTAFSVQMVKLIKSGITNLLNK